MLQDAEANALADKSKKAVVNIAYEFDNLLSKSELILNGSVNLNEDSKTYLEEVLNQIKNLYKENNLEKIYKEALTDLKYVYNLIIIEYIKSTLDDDLNSNGSGFSKPSGKIIDIDIE